MPFPASAIEVINTNVPNSTVPFPANTTTARTSATLPITAASFPTSTTDTSTGTTLLLPLLILQQILLLLALIMLTHYHCIPTDTAADTTSDSFLL